MSDLVVFLRARLDEREARIREFLAYKERLRDEDETADGGWHLWGEFGLLVDSLIKPYEWLAEVDAKRRIVADHEGTMRSYREICSRCGNPPGYDYEWQDAPCPTLRLLALPYADHPGYRQEWRP